MGVVAKPDGSNCGMTQNLCKDGAEGEVIILLNDTGSATAVGTVCRIGYDTTLNKLAAVALASGAYYEQVVVSAEVIASAAYGRFWIRGSGITMTVADSTYTADESLKVSSGTVVATGGAYAHADTDFGICEVGGDTTTSLTVTLLGRESLGA